MKKTIYVLLLFGCCVSCSQNEDKTAEKLPEKNIDKVSLAEKIKSLEDKLLTIQDATKDTITAFEMINKTELYIQNFPLDSLSPYLLFRAGDVARGSGKMTKAIELWEKVWRKNEDHKIAPKALFAMAFTYDAQLGNKKEADRYYRKFLFKYPEHPLVPEVRQLVRTVYKTPGELVKEFKKKAKENG